MVDYERLESYVEATSPNELCVAVSGMSAGIRGFKIGTTRKGAIDLKNFLIEPAHFGFRSVARSLHEYAADDEYKEALHGLKGHFGDLEEFYGPVSSPDEIDLSSVESAYDSLPRTYPPESLKSLQDLNDEQRELCEQTLDRMSEITDRFEAVSSVWDFLSVHYNVAELKYGRFSDQYKLLDGFRDDIETLDDKLENRIEKLEEDIQIDIDTEPFTNCQQAANNLLNELEGSE